MNHRHSLCLLSSALVAVALLNGCASNEGSSAGSSPSAKAAAPAAAAPAAATTGAGASYAQRYVATDGRTIEIGKSRAADGGTRFDNPHLEKGKCWVSSGFDFKGYDVLYLAPTASTAKVPDAAEDRKVHDLAKESLVRELQRSLGERGVFGRVVTQASDIPANAKVLKLENTITEFSKGGDAARYFVGLYGGGQPVLRVSGTVTDGSRKVFTYEARRSGTSAGARLGGTFMKDEDIQIEDIRSMVLDLSDFIAAIAGKYPAKN